IKQNRNERITYRYWYLPLLPMPNEKKNCSTSGRKSLKRAINKFRRKQLKLDKVTRHNHFGGYWA
ncbi:hypothetical protein, partial [Bacteroides xylanisolvens]|uniref:hypothetical protein n=1 Tax=Bacteroides xylanisolvens TaxID=371601 RepID=UPI0034A33B3F